MKRILFILPVAVSIFGSAFNPACAELVDRKHLIIAGGGVGIQTPMNDEIEGVYRSGFHYYIKGGFGIASHFSIMAEVAESRYRSTLVYKGNDTRTYLYRYGAVGIRYNFVAGTYIVPYIETLFGGTQFRYADYIDPLKSTVTTGLFPVGIVTFGTEFFIGPNWCIDGSIELYRVIGDVYLQPKFISPQPHELTGETFSPTGLHFRGGLLIFL